MLELANGTSALFDQIFVYLKNKYFNLLYDNFVNLSNDSSI